MPEKNNKVKIAVDADEKESKKGSEQAAKKTANDKKSQGKQSGGGKNGKKSQTKTSKQGSRGLMNTVIAALITALVVGGGIYAWQKNTKQELANELSQEAKNTRMDFEKRIDNLKNRLTNVESEKESIKKTAEELKEKAKLLADAKKEYSGEELGLKFEYPAVFGELTVSPAKAATGTKVKGEFRETDKVYLGAASQNYVPQNAATGSAQAFTSTLGFEERDDGYYFRTPKGDFKIEPIQEVETAGGRTALLLNKNSFTSTIEGSSSPVKIKEYLGAVVNIEEGDYSGVALVNSDFGVMPQQDFINMIKSIK